MFPATPLPTEVLIYVGGKVLQAGGERHHVAG